MIPEQFIDMAQAYGLLSELEPDQLRKLLPLAEEKEYGTGRLLFREGEHSDFLYLIISGEVALETVIGVQHVRVQRLQAGDAIGWSALKQDSQTHFQARALTPVTTIAFPGDRLRQTCERDPALGYSLTKLLLDLVTERLDATRIQMVNARRPNMATQ